MNKLKNKLRYKKILTALKMMDIFTSLVIHLVFENRIAFCFNCDCGFYYLTLSVIEF